GVWTNEKAGASEQTCRVGRERRAVGQQALERDEQRRQQKDQKVLAEEPEGVEAKVVHVREDDDQQPVDEQVERSQSPPERVDEAEDGDPEQERLEEIHHLRADAEE